MLARVVTAVDVLLEIHRFSFLVLWARRHNHVKCQVRPMARLARVIDKQHPMDVTGFFEKVGAVIVGSRMAAIDFDLFFLISPLGGVF